MADRLILGLVATSLLGPYHTWGSPEEEKARTFLSPENE